MAFFVTLFDRLVRARVGRHGLDYIISSADPTRPLEARLEWLVEVLAWMRTKPQAAEASRLNLRSGHVQILRLKQLLQSLERNTVYKGQVARCLRSILRDIDALELFRSTGLPGGHGLWAEAAARFTAKLIPLHTDGKDLGEAFDVLFPEVHDGVWLSQLDADLLRQLTALLHFEEHPREGRWNSVERDMAEALFLLASEAQTLGMAPLLRRRRAHPHRCCFIPLQDRTEAFLRGFATGPETVAAASLAPAILHPKPQVAVDLGLFSQQIGLCRDDLAQLKLTLQKEGVSLTLVYTLARLEGILTRMETLARILAAGDTGNQLFVPFLAQLIDDTKRHKSLKALWTDNAALLSRRITERNADTGHHYITRNQSEYGGMVKKATGGGVLTGLTVILKLAAADLPVAYLVKGLLNSLNYSVSFLAIQFLGCTLATKQPAMTAPAIAAHITDLHDDRELAKLIREIIHLVRSQVAAVFGNLVGVIPAAIALHYAIIGLFGGSMLTGEEAMTVLRDHSVFGWSPLFAAFTGVLLWLSSLFAGWADNWVALHNLPRAIRGNRRLRFVLGPRRLDQLATFCGERASAIGANVSLGFLLGLTPKVLAFAGLHLDVRHVTLTAGTLAFAAISIGSDVFRQHAFWQAVVCVGVIGILNVGVSFGLALSVALRARSVKTADKRRIYMALVSRVARRPLQILLPVGLD